MADSLSLAPPTLFTLFPDLKTPDEKAFKFMEIHYDSGSLRRAGRAMGIDPKTVKSIAEYLDNTEIGYRFKAILAEQTEDFASTKNFVSLFEDYHKEIRRLEEKIRAEEKHLSVCPSCQEKLPKSMTSVSQLTLIAEKRKWMEKLLSVSLACRPTTDGVRKGIAKERAKEQVDKYGDLLDDYPNTEGETVN